MSPTQIETLRLEITEDPLAIGYSACFPDSPGQAVELLNALTQNKVKDITCKQAMSWAAAGPYANIVDISNSAGHPCRASCLVLTQLFAAGLPIHLEDAPVKGMFDAWVATSIITQEEQDALMAIATAPASRAEVLGLPYITEADIRAVLEA